MSTPREVLDIDRCSLVIEPVDTAEFAQQAAEGAVVAISASFWLGTRDQLNQLIVELVTYANELDKQSEVAA